MTKQKYSPPKSSHSRAYQRQQARVDVTAVDAAALTPSLIQTEIRHNYATRFHMFLIVGSSIAVALLLTKGLLAVGVTEIWVRYLLSLLLAYVTFFCGVWVWLHLSKYGRFLRAQWGKRNDWNGDIPIDGAIDLMRVGEGATRLQPSYQGGGGNFDGGGASGGWDMSQSPSYSSSDSGVLDTVGDAVGGLADGAGDEGGCALVIAGILLAIVLFVIFGAAAYVIYQAPIILAEVVFEVMLGSPLTRGLRSLDGAHWSTALLRKTWLPFVSIAALAMGFAVYCNITFPKAQTMGDVLSMIVK